MTCWKLLVAGVAVGAGFCALAGCGSLGSGSFLVPDVDADGDGILDAFDVAPEDPRACTDGDGDGCDDCSLSGEVDPNNDGWDSGGDGACETPLDWDCMN